MGVRGIKPITGVCQACGVELPPKSYYGRARKWCSERCRKSQYAGTCIDCGVPTDGTKSGRQTQRCATCNLGRNLASTVEQLKAEARPRYKRIAELWRAGLSEREIGERVGLSQGAVHQKLTKMRKRGEDIPYRWKRTPEGLERCRSARLKVAA